MQFWILWTIASAAVAVACHHLSKRKVNEMLQNGNWVRWNAKPGSSVDFEVDILLSTGQEIHGCRYEKPYFVEMMGENRCIHYTNVIGIREV